MTMPERKRLHPATILMAAGKFGKDFLFGIVAVIGATMFGKGGDRSEWIFLVLGGAIGVFAIIPAIFKYLNFTYEITNDSLNIWSGLFFKQNRTIPLERIQNVTVKKGVIQNLLGVCSVMIETASGAGAEADLSVVTHAEADRLVQILRRDSSIPAEESPSAAFTAGLKDLIMAGATQNKAGIIFIFVVGLFQYVQEPAIDFFTKRVLKNAEHWVASTSAYLIVGGLLLFGFLFVGWLWSIVTTVIAYYGFRLEPSAGVLRIRRGLFTQLQTAVPLHRIQTVRMHEPILQRMMGYCVLFADSAASFEDKQAGGAIQLIPMIRKSNAGDLTSLIFPALNLADVEWQKVSPLTVRRGFIRYCFTSLVLSGMLLPLVHAKALFALPPLLIISWFAAKKRYEVLGYATKDGFLLSRSGIWKRYISALPVDRVQWTARTQDFFQTRLNLANVSAVPASSTMAGRVEIVDLPLEIASQIQESLLRDAGDAAGV